MKLELTDQVRQLVNMALNEDLGGSGDITTRLVGTGNREGEAEIVCKAAGTVAGMALSGFVFTQVDASLRIDYVTEDGIAVDSGTTIMSIRGAIASILTAERTALNFLQRLSGIATLTKAYVDRIKGTRTRILDTRKTTPAFRSLEKYAVRAGGGENHRTGLYDMALIKENHIQAAGSITRAVSEVRKGLSRETPEIAVEVETRTLTEVQEALSLAVDRIMLDNMTLEQVRQAVRMVGGRIELEVSGGVTLQTVRAFAETGVDAISVGALTHSAPALDISLLLKSS